MVKVQETAKAGVETTWGVVEGDTEVGEEEVVVCREIGLTGVNL